jgi:hypothetical protein
MELELWACETTGAMDEKKSKIIPAGKGKERKRKNQRRLEQKDY